MNRWLRGMLVLAVWLVIGAAITVMVAWGGVDEYDNYIRRMSRPQILGEHFTAPSTERIEPLTRWEVVVPQSWPPPIYGELREKTLWTLWSASDGVGPDFATHWGAWQSFGWPCRALRFEWWTDRLGATPWEKHYEWVILAPTMQHRVSISPLPVRPLWPGFAINTLLYAALAWGLWHVPPVLRRRHRRAGNRCIRCGYSLAGLSAAGERGAMCPECGSVPRGRG